MYHSCATLTRDNINKIILIYFTNSLIYSLMQTVLSVGWACSMLQRESFGIVHAVYDKAKKVNDRVNYLAMCLSSSSSVKVVPIVAMCCMINEKTNKFGATNMSIIKPVWKTAIISIIIRSTQTIKVETVFVTVLNKKLSYRRGTARCVLSVVILPITKQQCRNYLYDKSWPNRWYEVGGLVGGNVS